MNAPGWELTWVVSAGGPQTNFEQGNECVLLEDGSSIVAGKVMEQAVVAPESDNPIHTQDFGFEDVLLARLDPGGNPSWVRTAGAAGCDDARKMALAPDGGVLVVGYVEGEPVFAAGEPEETVLPELGCRDIFLARYDLDGRLEWIASAGGESTSSYGTSVAVMGDGSVAVGGIFYGVDTGDGPGTSVAFGQGTSAETVLETSGGRDGVLARYSSDGELEWAILGCVGGGDDTVRGLASDGDSVYAMGRFEGEAVCEGRSGNKEILTAKGGSSFFFAKYSGGGDLLWARDLGVDGEVSTRCVQKSVEVLANGDVAVTAEYIGTMPAGLDGNLNPVGQTENWQMKTIFLGRYASSGDTVWVATAHGTLFIPSEEQDWEGEDLAELDDGTIVLVGLHGAPTVFGEGEENETVLEGRNTDGFIALYRSTGHLEWAIGQQGEGETWTMGVDARQDSILATGMFTGKGVFGTGTADSVELETAGGMDMFVMRLNRADTPVIPK